MKKKLPQKTTTKKPLSQARINARCDIILVCLNDYLKSNFGCRKPIAYVQGHQIYALKNKSFDLMLRTAYPTEKSDRWPEETLIVARIYFREARVGHGSNFLKFIFKMAQGFDYKHVGIESCNPCAIGFAKKNQFIDTGKGHRDYIFAVENLMTE